MRRFIRVGVGMLGMFGLIVAMAAPAGAQGFPVELTCDGTTYNVVTNGNGDFTPARDSDSTLVFHPTAFGEFHGTFTPSGGGEPEEETDPPFERKNVPPNGHPTDHCTYQLSFSDENGTFTGSGSVTGWTSGTRQN